jgi:hypothetical protein
MIEFTVPADVADNPQKIQPEGVFLTAETLTFVRWRRHHNSKITARNNSEKHGEQPEDGFHPIALLVIFPN